MSYDLKPVKIPRLTGGTLKAFTKVVENPKTSWAVLPKMFNDAGITRFRNLEVETIPTYYPKWSTDNIDDRFSLSKDKFLNTVLKTPVNDKDFNFYSINDYANGYRSGKFTPEDVAQKIIDSIHKSNAANPPQKALTQWKESEILFQARQSTERINNKQPLSIFDGVPIAIKEELDVLLYETTGGTTFLGKSEARQDATVVRNLRLAGAVIIGKTNMHEIGLGVTGHNPHFGTPRNPYDSKCYTGGSSSGSAALVGSGLVPVAIGADGGGSIRIPAAFCGGVGLKPTFGRVSEYGALPLDWTVAHIGPIGGNALDVATCYALIAGKDEADPHSMEQPDVLLNDLTKNNLKDVTIGIYPPWFHDADSHVVKKCQTAIKEFEIKGAKIKEISIANLDTYRVAHIVTIVSEMLSGMGKYYRESPANFGTETRLNLALANYFTSTDYIKAQRVRTQAMQAMREVFETVDFIATPTAAIPAPQISKDALKQGESNISQTMKITRYANLANLTGLPAISFPVGYSKKGLPIGLQLMAKPWHEHMLLKMAQISESFVEKEKPKSFYDILK